MRHTSSLPVLLTGALLAAALAAGPAAGASSAAPRVTGLSATSGPLAGGAHVVVRGSGFAEVRTVLVGRATAHVLRVTPHALIVVLPGGRAGRVDVRVVTGAGRSKAVTADLFTYVAPPSVSSLRPTSRSAADGTRVTIRGKNFLHVKAVLFGKTKGTKLHAVSSTTLLVTAPAHAPGIVDLHVTTAYGTSRTVHADRFAYPAPTLAAQPVAPAPPSPSPAPGPPPAPVPALAITTTSLPSLVSGNGTIAVTLTAQGGAPPYTWTAHGLPNGLTLSAAGALTGSSYAVAGTRRVSVTATDSAGRKATATLPLTLRPYAGTVYSWGQNDFGQLASGVASNTDTATPTAAMGLSGVVSVVGGNRNGYAVTSDGTAWEWGDDQYGELGHGETSATDQLTPIAVPGLANVVSIAAAEGSAYALTSDGTVFSWGEGGDGELGTGSSPSNASPAQVPGLTGVVAVAAGTSSAYALRSDGTVYGWGFDREAELGDGGSDTPRQSPVQIPGLTDIVAITAGGTTAFALHADGTVSGWGDNTKGYLGTTTTAGSMPALIPGISAVTQLVDGGQTTFALRADGTVWSWGASTAGQSGTGANTDVATPTQIPDMTGVEAIGATEFNGYAILAGGVVKVWGSNYHHGVGDGSLSTVNRLTPITASSWQARVVALTGGGQDTSYVIKRPLPVLVPPGNPIPPTS